MILDIADNAKVISAEIDHFGFIESGELRIGFDVVVRLSDEAYNLIDKNDGALEDAAKRTNEEIAALISEGRLKLLSPIEVAQNAERVKTASTLINIYEAQRLASIEAARLEGEREKAYSEWFASGLKPYFPVSARNENFFSLETPNINS